MLGIAVRKLVTLPSQVLGLVCDLLEKLSDPEWIEATKKFLRKEESWPVEPIPNFPQYPPDGVEFELTLDGDAVSNDPTEMVRRDGYGSPEKWKFTGKKVSGIQTRRFKLVSIGYQQS